MLGLVYSALGSMVEQRYGVTLWNQVLREADIPDFGAFVFSEPYPDEQMLRLLAVLERKLEVPQNELLKIFGEYTLGILLTTHPDIVKKFADAKSLLLHVDDHIHQEVMIYHPVAALPVFECIDTAPQVLIMHYRSPRRLCYLAEGLIQGVGKHYHTEVALSHTQCLHRGDSQCTFELNFNA